MTDQSLHHCIAQNVSRKNFIDLEALEQTASWNPDRHRIVEELDVKFTGTRLQAEFHHALPYKSD
jgi:hypothetical protein